MRLTYEMLHEVATANGKGWTRAQLKLLGVKWPPRKGWLTRLVNTEISETAYADLHRLRKERIETVNANTLVCMVPDPKNFKATCMNELGHDGEHTWQSKLLKGREL